MVSDKYKMDTSLTETRRKRVQERKTAAVLFSLSLSGRRRGGVG